MHRKGRHDPCCTRHRATGEDGAQPCHITRQRVRVNISTSCLQIMYCSLIAKAADWPYVSADDLRALRIVRRSLIVRRGRNLDACARCFILYVPTTIHRSVVDGCCARVFPLVTGVPAVQILWNVIPPHGAPSLTIFKNNNHLCLFMRASDAFASSCARTLIQRQTERRTSLFVQHRVRTKKKHTNNINIWKQYIRLTLTSGRRSPFSCVTSMFTQSTYAVTARLLMDHRAPLQQQADQTQKWARRVLKGHHWIMSLSARCS
jgi:hypothetical protein